MHFKAGIFHMTTEIRANFQTTIWRRISQGMPSMASCSRHCSLPAIADQVPCMTSLRRQPVYQSWRSVAATAATRATGCSWSALESLRVASNEGLDNERCFLFATGREFDGFVSALKKLPRMQTDTNFKCSVQFQKGSSMFFQTFLKRKCELSHSRFKARAGQSM